MRIYGGTNIPGAPGNLHTLEYRPGFNGESIGITLPADPSNLGQIAPIGAASLIPGEGHTLAGSPGYMPTEREIDERLFQYGFNNTPLGGQLKQNIENFRNRYQHVFKPQANMGVPAGFQNKIVS